MFTLATSRTGSARLPLDALRTRFALFALQAEQPRSLITDEAISDGNFVSRISLFASRALLTGWTGNSAVGSSRSSRSNRTFRSNRPLRALFALGALLTLRTLLARQTLFTLRAGHGAVGSSGTNRTLGTSRAFRSCRSNRTLFTLGTNRAFWTNRALFTLRAGNSAVSTSRTSGTNRAFGTDGALFTLRALRTFRASNRLTFRDRSDTTLLVNRHIGERILSGRDSGVGQINFKGARFGDRTTGNGKVVRTRLDVNVGHAIRRTISDRCDSAFAIDREVRACVDTRNIRDRGQRQFDSFSARAGDVTRECQRASVTVRASGSNRTLGTDFALWTLFALRALFSGCSSRSNRTLLALVALQAKKPRSFITHEAIFNGDLVG